MYNPDQSASESVFANLSMDSYLRRHREWSWHTFGSPEERAKHFNTDNPVAGVVDHIRNELKEIEKDPTDFTEWLDIIILGVDGYLRAGGSWKEFLIQLFGKQRKNFNRIWPAWRSSPPNKAIEHQRGYQD